MRYALLLTLLLIPAAISALAAGATLTIDATKLQGAWKVTALETDGKQAPENSLKGKQFLFEGDKISLTGKPEDLRTCRTLMLAKPKAMDIAGGAAGGRENSVTKAIYELEDDTLRICFSEAADVERPKDFDTTGSQYKCFTLERVQR